jgi:hypothetical protein
MLAKICNLHLENDQSYMLEILLIIAASSEHQQAASEERGCFYWYLYILAVQLFKFIDFNNYFLVCKNLTAPLQNCCYFVAESHQATEKTHTDFKSYPRRDDEGIVRNPFLKTIDN